MAFRKELEKRFGMTVLAGVGSVRAGGVDLARSYREAVAALHMAIQTGQNPSFVEATAGEREGVPIAGLRVSMRELAEALSLASKGRLAIAREKFTRQVLFASHGQFENVRVHFLSALQILLERFEARSGVPRNVARTLGEEPGRQGRGGPKPAGTHRGVRWLPQRVGTLPGESREAGSIAKVEDALKAIEEEPGSRGNSKSFVGAQGCPPRPS
jgi:hypothetical protein